jgi:hypothetical protein
MCGTRRLERFVMKTSVSRRPASSTTEDWKQQGGEGKEQQRVVELSQESAPIAAALGSAQGSAPSKQEPGQRNGIRAAFRALRCGGIDRPAEEACGAQPSEPYSPPHPVAQLKRMWPTGMCTECGVESPTVCVPCLASLKERDARRMAVERELKLGEREIETGLQFTPEGHLARGNASRARRQVATRVAALPRQGCRIGI